MSALGLFVACLSGATMPQDITKIELESYWFVFLVRGENREALSDEARAKGMEGHLGNLTRLSNEGKAVAAGPFAGNQDRRGIVVLKGDKYKSKDEVAKEFADDPFVKADRLRAQVHRWMTPKGSIKKWREPVEMKSYVFLILERGENKSPLSEKDVEEIQAAHLRHIFGMIASGDLGFAGPFADDTDLRGLGFFKHGDIEKAKRLMAEDPLVKAGRLKPTFLTLYMAAGIVGD